MTNYNYKRCYGPLSHREVESIIKKYPSISIDIDQHGYFRVVSGDRCLQVYKGIVKIQTKQGKWRVATANDDTVAKALDWFVKHEFKEDLDSIYDLGQWLSCLENGNYDR